MLRNIVFLVIMSGFLSGCASSGRPVVGPFSYMYNAKLSEKVPARVMRENKSVIEMRATSDGKGAIAMVDISKFDSIKNMTWGEITAHGGLSLLDLLLEYQVAKTGVHYGEKWFDDNDEEDAVPPPNVDGISVANSGTGSVQVDYEVQAGSRLPNNIAVGNTGGGSVHVDVIESAAP